MAKLAMIRQSLARQANAEKIRRTFKMPNVKPKRKTKKNLVQQAMNVERQLRQSARLKEKALKPKDAPKLADPVVKKVKKLVKPNVIYPTSLKPGGLTQNNANKIKQIDSAWEKYIIKRAATIAVNHRPVVNPQNLPEFNVLAQTLGKIHM